MATSRSPLSLNRYICLSVSPPPLPRRTSVYSRTGVSMGANPKLSKVFFENRYDAFPLDFRFRREIPEAFQDFGFD